jgi:hypothetical protein
VVVALVPGAEAEAEQAHIFGLVKPAQAHSGDTVRRNPVSVHEVHRLVLLNAARVAARALRALVVTNYRRLGRKSATGAVTAAAAAVRQRVPNRIHIVTGVDQLEHRLIVLGRVPEGVLVWSVRPTRRAMTWQFKQKNFA